MDTQPDKIDNTRLRRTAAKVAALTLASLVLAVVSAPGAAAAEPECIRFPAHDHELPWIITWGDFDLWVLEAQGEVFRFENPGTGTKLWTGNGANMEYVSKCTMAEPVQPAAEPAPEPTPEPAPEPTPEPARPEDQSPPADDTPPADAPPAEDTPPADQTPPAQDTPPADQTPPAQDDGEIGIGSSPWPQGPPAQILPVPFVAEDAEVLGTQLARTGSGYAMPLAIAGTAVIALGLALTRAGSRAAALTRHS